MNTLLKALLWGGGAYLLYESGILAKITGGLIPTPGATGGTQPQAPSGPPAFNSLASTYQRVLNAAITDFKAGDRNNQLDLVGTGDAKTTWNAWNYFLGQQTGFSDLPDYTTLTGQPDPNVPMASAQFWQLIAPWLTKNHGLSGLLGLGGDGMGCAGCGMGASVQSLYATPRNPWYPGPRGWAA